MPDLRARMRYRQGAGGASGGEALAEKCGGWGAGLFFSETHHVVTLFCFCGGFLLVRRLQVFSLERIGWMRGRHILFRIAACGVRAFVAFENRDVLQERLATVRNG